MNGTEGGEDKEVGRMVCREGEREVGRMGRGDMEVQRMGQRVGGKYQYCGTEGEGEK